VSSSAASARAGEIRRVLGITLLLNLAVSAGKIVVGTLSASLTMVADGYHSLLDGANNVIGLIVVGWAAEPPDLDHPYGHRKFETAASLAIGLALLGLAYRVTEDALSGLAEPQLPNIGPLNWVVMGATLAVNVFVTRYESREGQRLQSDFLLADSNHTRSDIYVTLGVVASFAGARAGVARIDGLVALAVAALVAYMAAQILVRSFNVLTDLAPIAVLEIERIARSIPEVRGCRAARSRGASGAVFVDLTILLEPELTLREAHEVADRVEDALQRQHPAIVDAVVHLEPVEEKKL